MRPIVPIAHLSRRIPEAGRIRIGVKTGKAMKAIDTFRFTSHDQAALEQIAGLYGGTVRPWNERTAAEGQFEVITEAAEIRIVLPPDPLGGTPIYETWSGGGCQRRCDGLTCTRLVQGPDGPEPIDVECLCAAEGALTCDPKTRLSVMLAGVRFGGAWRLESKSWTVAQEMPGMVELIQSLQDKGLTKGVLALKHRRTVTAGETHRFIIPVLGIEDSLEAIASGAAQLGALPTPSAAGELEAGDLPALDAGDPDGEVVDAELVDDEPAPDGVISRLSAEIALLDDGARGRLKDLWKASGYPSLSSGQLTGDQAADVADWICDLEVETPDPDGGGSGGGSRPDGAGVADGNVREADGADHADASTGPEGGDEPHGADSPSETTGSSPSDGFVKMTRAQSGKLHAIAGEMADRAGLDGDAKAEAVRATILHAAQAVTGHPVDSRTLIAKSEAAEIIDQLEAVARGDLELHLRADGSWVLRDVPAHRRGGEAA